MGAHAKLHDADVNSARDAASANIDDLRADFSALQDDVAELMRTLKVGAKGEAGKQYEKGKSLADEAKSQAEELGASAEDTVRRHPLAALGTAFVAGLLVASLRR